MTLGDAVRGGRIIGVLVDPVFLDLGAWHDEAFPHFFRMIVQRHGNLLIGPAGRVYVGWLGPAMLVFGISGLILWWSGRSRTIVIALAASSGARLISIKLTLLPARPYRVSLAHPAPDTARPRWSP